MKISILGPSDSIEKILEYSDRIPADVELVGYHALGLKDSDRLVSSCARETDGILCTGPSVYDSASLQNVDIPMTYVPHDETGLFQLIATHDLTQYDFLSIDLLDEDVVAECMQGCDVPYLVLSHTHGLSEANYLSFHLQNCKQFANVLVITTFTPIYQHFSEIGAPVERLYTSHASIKSRLVQLELAVRSNRAERSKIAVQIIQLAQTKDRMTQMQNTEQRIQFEEKLLPYIKQVEGAYFSYGRNEYIIFSTKGQTMTPSSQKLFHTLLLTSEIDIFSGIGIGNTASMAEINGQKALNLSLKSAIPSFYSLDEDGQILGPIGSQYIAAQTYSGHSVENQKRADRTKLSVGYIQKLQELIRITDKTTFSPEELAELLHITKRSARRVLKQLVDGGYATVAEKELTIGVGRPQNITKIKESFIR